MNGKKVLKSGEESVGARIKRYRVEGGMTQMEFAERLGIAKSMVSYYENDRVDMKRSVLEEIADALNVSVSCLVEGDAESAEEAELLAAFRELKSGKLREHAIKMIRFLGELDG